MGSSCIPKKFEHGMVHAAFDAGIAVWETMSMLMDQDRAHGVAAANAAYETVHMYLQTCHGLKARDPRFNETIHWQGICGRRSLEMMSSSALSSRTRTRNGQTYQVGCAFLEWSAGPCA
jgi:hypothetical protein